MERWEPGRGGRSWLRVGDGVGRVVRRPYSLERTASNAAIAVKRSSRSWLGTISSLADRFSERLGFAFEGWLADVSDRSLVVVSASCDVVVAKAG